MSTRRVFARVGGEEGFALVLALGVSLVLGMAGATVVAYASSNERAARYSAGAARAEALAEAGLNYAYATLYAASSPTLADAVPERTVTLAGGTATYYGTLADGVWMLVGVGRVANPTGPSGADVVRTRRAKVRLSSSRRGSSNNAVWNYVYADDPSGCTTLGNSSEVNVPLYVRGNLCLNNSSKVTGYALQVGGTLTISGTQASVGLPDAPVAEAHIGGGCASTPGGAAHLCTSADRVWATVLDASPTGLTKPPVDLDYWYANAAPGPSRGCTVGSLAFDDDGVLNRSRAAFDLTPAKPYDCRVYDASGKLVGQLSWQPGAPGTLTVAGTIFFDGDVVMGQYATAVYAGRATIYASGRFTIGQQSSLCGVAGCDETWKATENLLAIVAGYPTGDSVTISNYSVFQGAIYAVANYREGNNSQCWGPIIANQLYLQNSTLNHYVPIGVLLPGMPASYEESVSLANEPGSWG